MIPMKTTPNSTATAGHTPGPWYFIPDPDGPDLIIAPLGNIARLNYSNGNPYRDNVAEQAANGALLAAAPDMLEALRAFEQGPPDGDNPDAWFAQYALNLEWARKAIARATGGQEV